MDAKRAARKAANFRWNRSIKGRYIVARKNAKARGLDFTISLEDFALIQASNCYYCGTSKLSDTGANIDRVNSSLGYVPGNCKPCCPTCNTMKGGLAESVFIKQITKLFKKLRRVRRKGV